VTADLTAAANSGSAAIKAASSDLDVLLETRNRDAEQANPGEIQQFKQEAGQKLRAWAKVTDEELKDIRELVDRGHGSMKGGEAQALWRLLDQLKTNIYRYVVDKDSLLQDYQPLQRASAPQTLVPFWGRFDAAFDAVDSYKAALSKYEEIYERQTMTEIRSFERVCRVDSREIRNHLLEFIDLARPLMQAIGKL
jgi:hypothetical protein